MLEIKDYINAIKEIKEINKKEKLELTESMVIAILQEIGKDRRTPQRNTGNTEYTENTGDEATEKQIAFMRKLNLDIPEEGLTKEEAKQLIKEAVEKQEKGKKKKNEDYY